ILASATCSREGGGSVAFASAVITGGAALADGPHCTRTLVASSAPVAPRTTSANPPTTLRFMEPSKLVAIHNHWNVQRQAPLSVKRGPRPIHSLLRAIFRPRP